jgi:integrase
MKLTQKLIEQMPYPKKGQTYIFDDDLPGFGVRISRGRKSFFVQAYVKNKKIRYTIGRMPLFNLARARLRAKEVLLDMAYGINPQEEKKQVKLQSTTLQQVATNYLKDRNLKPNSIRDINKHMNGIFQDWKDKPFASINIDQVKSRFHEFSERSKAQCNQAFRILRAILNYGMENYKGPDDKPLRIYNPVNILSSNKMWHPTSAKEGDIPLNEIGKFWHTIQQKRQDPALNVSSRSVIDAVSFVLLSGGRREEVASLRWENVNLDNAYWHIEDPKNKKPITLPMSKQAVDLLLERPRLNQYVFCSDKGRVGHINSGAIRNKAFKLHGVTAHDLRRTFQAIAITCGIELYKAKLLMNHRQKNDITLKHYIQTSNMVWLKPEIDAIGAFVERKTLEYEHQVINIEAKRQQKEIKK